jgi:hypothetical protein
MLSSKRREELKGIRRYAMDNNMDYENLRESLKFIEKTRKKIYDLVPVMEEKAKGNGALNYYAMMLGLVTTISAAPSKDYPEQAISFLLSLCDAMNMEYSGMLTPSEQFELMAKTSDVLPGELEDSQEDPA